MNNTTLTQMLKLHKSLLQHYISIEGLPPYPLDLQQKKSQKLIKDFLYRAIEELGESFEVLVLALGSAATNDMAKAELCVKDYFEELADFYHFMTEILIYSDMDEYTLRDIGDEDALEEDDKSAIALIILMGQKANAYDGLLVNKRNCYPIAYTFESVVGRVERAGQLNLSSEVIETMEKFNWGITYYLTKAGNSLKNKAWAQEDKISNLTNYHHFILEAWKTVGRIWAFLGISEAQVFVDYQNKNIINHERIQKGY